MPNLIYPRANEQLLQGGIDLLTANVKVVAVDTGAYTYSAAHEFLSDIPAGARIATSPNLSGKTVTNGTFDCADFTFAAFSGPTVEALVVFIDTGTAATSRLIAYLDQNALLPFTPNGSTLTVQVPSGLFTVSGTTAAVFQKTAEAMLSGGIALGTADVKVVLIDLGAYTHSQGHQFLSDIPVGARVAISATLATKTFASGTFDSADTVFTAVTGPTAEAFAVFIDTGSAATSRLVSFDNDNPGLPFTPNGGNLNMATPNGWFTLAATVS